MSFAKTLLSCILLFVLVAAMTGCVSFTPMDKRNYAQLQLNGITVDHPAGNFVKPNSAVAAGCLNLLPGIGNFYLCSGDGSDGTQAVYGVLNLLLWPFSIIWGVPEAAIDANTLNKQYLLYYYQFTEDGKAELQKRGITLQ